MGRYLILSLFFVSLALICCQDYKKYECGPNESVDRCGGSCEPSCEQRNFSAVICVQCTNETEGCRCKEGFLRYKGRCIRPKDCPPEPPAKPTKPTKPVHCAHGEIFAACARTCEANCTHLSEPEICSLIRCATQGCRCDLSKGMVRYKGRCIHKSQCPRKCC